MWNFVKLFCIFALVLNSEAVPKKYHGLHYQRLKSTAADDDIKRLSTDVVPQSYILDLVITEENLNSGNFSGTVTIALTVNTEGTKSFQIHAKKITIDKNDDSAVTLNGEKVSYTDPDDNDFITITSDAAIPDQAKLTIKYSGLLSDTDMDGFYRSSYQEDGKQVYLATTQFEQTGARRAFPSFDEPAFKATFDITITYPEGYTALSNQKPADKQPTAPGEGLITKFQQTPKMSTYLVAFIVSKFTCDDGDQTNGQIPTSICARTAAEDSMAHAKDVAPKALDAMKNYTSIDYKEFGVAKMTQAAIPDFEAGAMENWGMVTYREVDILWTKEDSSNYYKQTVTTVITHEFSHQWFGDYVTLDWWNDVFLNEGFATYFEYHASDLIQPDWELPKQFVIEQVQPVLLSDSDKDSHELTWEPPSLDSLNYKFNDISYNKGGTILRMLDHFLGRENFKKGLNEYLTGHPYENGSPDFLWDAFNKHAPTDSTQKLPNEVDVKKIMDNWVNKPGYPVLTVTLENKKNVTISQKHFSSSNDTSVETKWYVPITYITSKNPNATDTTTQAWLLPDSDLTITLEEEVEWIVLNKQQVGYYRVAYDDKTLASIKDALTNNVDSIDEISRAQLVDDQLNFARAGVKGYDKVLEFLTFLKSDTSYYSWYSAFNGFTYLLQHTTNSTVKAALNKYVVQLMDNLLKSEAVTKENTDNQISTLTRVLAKTWACNLDNEDCVSDALQKFSNFFKNENSGKVEANLRSFVYCTALRHSNKSSDDYNFLYNQYKKNDVATEKITILKALGCINSTAERKTYLNTSLSSDIRLQDARYVYSSVYSNIPDGVDDFLDFIQGNHASFEDHFGKSYSLTDLIETVGGYITTNDQKNKLVALSKTTGLDADDTKALSDAVDTNLNTITDLEKTLKSYFKLDGSTGDVSSAGAMNGFYLGNLALLLVVYFFK